MVLRIPDKELQTVLRDYADREIALMLKACEEPVRARVLDSVSERRRDFIRMEMDALGEVRRKDAETAVADFLGYLQLLEQKGELTIIRETEQYV
jgi:flagellar motor switch protein FliG